MQQILFVDDDSKHLSSIERLLRKQTDKWRLYFAESVDDAINCLNTHHLDLVISDVLMPGKSGIDLLELMKMNTAMNTIPVIMVTGQIESKFKLRVLDMGAIDFLSKPLEKAELLARINNCLRTKRYQDQIVKQNLQLENEIIDRAKLARLTTDICSALIQEKKTNLLQTCCQSIVDHLGVAFARIWIKDHHASQLELIASAGLYTHIDGKHQYVPMGKYKIGIIAQDKRPHLTNAVIGDPLVSEQEWAQKEKMIAFAGHPLIVKGRLVGVLAMFSQQELTDSTLVTLSSIADGIALGIVQKQSEDRAHFYSHYDSLTLLPNRRFFYVFLGKMVNYANRYLKKFSVVLIDIDNFSRINESLGPITGDKCLKIISQRLLVMLRDSDCIAMLSDDDPPIARMDGDQFAILLQDTSKPHQINKVVCRLLKDLSKNMQVEGRDLNLSVSIGIAVYPDDGDSIADLFKNTETALSQAKKKGKNNFVFYSQSMNISSLEILDLEINLRSAIEKKEFCLYYQPKVELTTNKIIGAEALIRWKTSNKKMISPAQFIPVAEQTGLIIPIGDWVVETACVQNMAWQKSGIGKIPIAVNVSGLQFGQKDFIDKILGYLELSGLSPEYLELEVTETTLMMNPEIAIENLKTLKKYGIKISLDDFGTGYSSLAYLQKLPIDQLKIDISFIKNILTNPNDAVMVKTIIAMAHSLDLKVIAEGVEDVDQLEYLAVLNCDVVQGYLFSRPVPSAEFKVLLKNPFEI